jgi:hypothetical protein
MGKQEITRSIDVEDFLQETPEPLRGDEWIDMDVLLSNLNSLIGYFGATKSEKASKTVWYAEQTIKDLLTKTKGL